MPPDDPHPALPVVRLGRMGYREAYERQLEHHARILDARQRGEDLLGTILLVEHDPVITLSRKAAAGGHLLASPAVLAERGVALEPTDRGGDITYHGPGQLVCYPIVDLQRLGIRLHEYLRLLEQAVIKVCRGLGIPAGRDDDATGVWTLDELGRPAAKICAIGVRVRRWITLHGLALNVAPDLDHFALIVPCGLHGRLVTSIEREAGAGKTPVLDEAGVRVADALRRLLLESQGEE
jgi:lipoyl(octanoyl) transferase